MQREPMNDYHERIKRRQDDTGYVPPPVLSPNDYRRIYTALPALPQLATARSIIREYLRRLSEQDGSVNGCCLFLLIYLVFVFLAILYGLAALSDKLLGVLL